MVRQSHMPTLWLFQRFRRGQDVLSVRQSAPEVIRNGGTDTLAWRSRETPQSPLREGRDRRRLPRHGPSLRLPRPPPLACGARRHLLTLVHLAL